MAGFSILLQNSLTRPPFLAVETPEQLVSAWVRAQFLGQPYGIPVS